MVTVTATTRLVKMSEGRFETRNAAEDIRGRAVHDRDGHEIGKVQDLFVDDAEHRVRFLEVRAGGFLGIGATALLIPVDAVARVEADVVHLDQTRERITAAPAYDPRLHKDIHWADYCHYYGCTPFWEREDKPQG